VIFGEIHAGLPRQGPGNNQSTGRAYAMLGRLPPQPSILDIGCGPGMQTVELAKRSGGEVTGLDVSPSFLAELKARAAAAGLGERIKTIEASMFALGLPEESYDLIWSEGAIYIIGFAKGLEEWRPLLRSGGYLVASHISWLKPDIPVPPKVFWGKNYPAIASMAENLAIAETVGYRAVGHFPLPDEGWWDEYYRPLERNLGRLKEKYRDNREALAAIAQTREEIELFRDYSDCYGYVFYVLQKL